MLIEKIMELERRLTFVESELAAERAENRQLRRHRAKRTYTTRSIYLTGLLGVALFAGLALSPFGVASSAAGQRPVTRLEAPVLIVGKSGNAIAEFSEDPGRYGLTVNGPTGGSTLIGSTKPTGEGTIRLFAPGQKLIGQINQTGFQVFDPATDQSVAVMDKEGFFAFNSAGKAAASLGARAGGSGYLTLATPNGDGIVEAGMTQDNRGIVRVYPLGGPPPTVIPKFIMGGKPK